MSNTQVEHAPEVSLDEDDLDGTAGIYDELEEEISDGECLIGLMRIHAAARLELIAADPRHARFLAQVIDRMNGKPEISVRSEEPPERMFELRSTTIERGDPRFAEALLIYVRDHYGLRIA
jgi:hypothetical protein